MSNDLVKLEQAERMLAAIASAKDAKQVIDFAEAARVFAKQMKLGTAAANHATVIKLKAERRLAELVDEGQKQGKIESAGGDRTITRSPGNGPAQLREIGVSSQRLAEARKIAADLSEDDIDKLAAKATKAGKELTRVRVLKQAEDNLQEKRFEASIAKNPELWQQTQEMLERGIIRLPFEIEVDTNRAVNKLESAIDFLKDLLKRAESDQQRKIMLQIQPEIDKLMALLVEDVIDNAR